MSEPVDTPENEPVGEPAGESVAGDAVARLERELTLLARHHLSAAHHNPELRLDRSGYQLLARLELEPMTLGRLAQTFRLDVSTVNRQVAALQRAGLVERIADPAGGTARLVRPTSAGVAALHDDRRIKRARIAHVVHDWRPDRLAELVGLLTEFNVSIEALEGRPWPRDTDTGTGTDHPTQRPG